MDMRITVIAGSRERSVEELRDGRLRVSVRAKARDGEANDEVREAIAEYLHVPVSAVRIVRGTTTPAKTVRVGGGKRPSQT